MPDIIEIITRIREVVSSGFDRNILSKNDFFAEFKEKALNPSNPLPPTLYDFALVSIALSQTPEIDKNNPAILAMQRISDAYYSRINKDFTDFERHVLAMRSDYGIDSHWGDDDFCLKVLKSACSPNNHTKQKNAI